MRSAEDIQTDLTAAYEARMVALSAQEYTLDTGQGRQTVKRANLTEINKTIRELEAELAAVTAVESGCSGIQSLTLERY